MRNTAVFRYTRGRVFSNISFHILIVANIYIYLCSYFFHCKTVLRPYPCHYWSVVAHCKTEFSDLILATTGRWWPIAGQRFLDGGGPLQGRVFLPYPCHYCIIALPCMKLFPKLAIYRTKSLKMYRKVLNLPLYFSIKTYNVMYN